MQQPAASLHCPNHRCQAPNPTSNKFCQTCRTPLIRRYLWAVDNGLKEFSSGEILSDRYIVMQDSIVLDMKPSMPPDTPEEVPSQLMSYLKLSPYSLHIPQVYGRLEIASERRAEVWLLELAAIAETNLNQGQVLPAFLDSWKTASPLRQLHWLWQIANLWQPMSLEGVASSLLNYSYLVRVDGSWVRLLELQPDATPVTLQELGEVWTDLVPHASPTITDFLNRLIAQLQQGEIRSSEQLMQVLDRGLAEGDRAYTRTYEIVTFSDQGPNRRRNEDSCYPSSNTGISNSSFAIVCDGIGGHEGGDVASSLAIQTLQQQVNSLPSDLTSDRLTEALEKAVCVANDAISDRNDTEKRSDRQRMGTTVVMAYGRAREMYITHVGDSRVYWIAQQGCRQITQDDDVASRDVRLGYALYREALQQPSSGSLVQALGMGASSVLHPTVQRFILDEDCIFLLCSDGLSDYDRVEQYWETEILPVLEGNISLESAGQRLIEIANSQNGHDNATVALVRCQIQSSTSKIAVLSLPQPQPLVVTAPPTSAPAPPTSLMKTQPLARPKRRSATQKQATLLPILGALVLLGVGGGVLAYLLSSRVRNNVIPTVAAPIVTPSVPSLAVGDRLKLTSSTLVQSNPSANLTVPAQSVLQVLNSPTEDLVRLQVCWLPNSPTPSPETSASASPSPSPRSSASPSPSPVSSASPSQTDEAQLQPGQVIELPLTQLKPDLTYNLLPKSNAPMGRCRASS